MPVQALSVPMKLGVMVGTVVLAGILITLSIHHGVQNQNQTNSGSNTCAKGSNGQACAGNGKCTKGVCVCKTGFSGVACDIPTAKCPTGVSPADPTGTEAQCSGNAEKCAGGECVCKDGWSGANCSVPVAQCPNIAGKQCNGHGTCSGTTCTCTDLYSGAACQDPPPGTTCPMGINPTTGNLEQCSGDTCNNDGSCACAGGRTGLACQIPGTAGACPVFNGQQCGGAARGTCDAGTQTCQCKPQYDGYACNVQVPVNPVTGAVCSTYDPENWEGGTFGTYKLADGVSAATAHAAGPPLFNIHTQEATCPCGPKYTKDGNAYCGGCSADFQPSTIPLPAKWKDTPAAYDNQCVGACPGTDTVNYTYTCSGNGTCNTQGTGVCTCVTAENSDCPSGSSNCGEMSIGGTDGNGKATCAKVYRAFQYRPKGSTKAALNLNVPIPAGQVPTSTTLNVGSNWSEIFDNEVYAPPECPGYVTSKSIPPKSEFKQVPPDWDPTYIVRESQQSRPCFGKGTCKDGTCDFSGTEGVDVASGGRYCAAGYQGILRTDWYDADGNKDGTWDIGPCMPCVFTDENGNCVSSCDATDWDYPYPPPGLKNPQFPQKYSGSSGAQETFKTATNRVAPTSQVVAVVRSVSVDTPGQMLNDYDFGQLILHYGYTTPPAFNSAVRGAYVVLADTTLPGTPTKKLFALCTVDEPDPFSGARAANANGVDWLDKEASVWIYTTAGSGTPFIWTDIAQDDAKRKATQDVCQELLKLVTPGITPDTGKAFMNLDWTVIRGPKTTRDLWTASEHSNEGLRFLEPCGGDDAFCLTRFTPVWDDKSNLPGLPSAATFLPCQCPYDYDQGGNGNLFCDASRGNCCIAHAPNALHTDPAANAQPCGAAGMYSEDHPFGCTGTAKDGKLYPCTGIAGPGQTDDDFKRLEQINYTCTCDAGFTSAKGEPPQKACQACSQGQLVTRFGTGATLPVDAPSGVAQSTYNNNWVSSTVATKIKGTSSNQVGTTSGCCVNQCEQKYKEGLCGMRDGCGGTCDGDSHCAQLGGCLGHRGSGKSFCAPEEKCCERGGPHTYSCSEYSIDADHENVGGFCMFRKYCGVKNKCIWLRCGPPGAGLGAPDNGVVPVTWRNHPGKNSDGVAEADGCPPSHSCFHGWARVTMADGSTKHARDVEAGDMVMDVHGNPTKVLFNDEQAGGRHVVSINGRPYPFVTASHPWYAPDGDSRIIVDVNTSEAHRAYATTVPMRPGSEVVWKGLDGSEHSVQRVDSIRPFYIPHEVVVYDILTEAHTLIVEGFAFWDEMPELERDPAATAVVLHVTDYINAHVYDWATYDTAADIAREPECRAYRHAIVDAVAQACAPMAHLALTGVHISAGSAPTGFQNWAGEEQAKVFDIMRQLKGRLDASKLTQGADDLPVRQLMQVGSTVWGVFYRLAREMSEKCTAEQFWFLLNRMTRELDEELGRIKEVEQRPAHLSKWRAELEAQRAHLEMMR